MIGAIESIRTDRTKALRVHRAGIVTDGQQQLRGLRRVMPLADRAIETSSGNNLTSLGTTASIELGDQVTHRPVATGVEQFLKLGNVVPPCRCLARVVRSGLRQPTSGHAAHLSAA